MHLILRHFYIYFYHNQLMFLLRHNELNPIQLYYQMNLYKVDIVNRFSNEAKTIEQSKALYESIKRELNKTNPTLNINESVTANGSKVLNEDKVYKSDDLIKTIDFMNRVMNC